jgi:hypothetical protein
VRLPVRPSLLALVVVALLSGAPAATSLPSGGPHLPDLVTRTPADLSAQWVSGHKLLRLSNVVVNLGDGPLEIRPKSHGGTRTTVATQRIYTHDASGAWAIWGTHRVGTFAFHPSHDHWHLEDFASYEVLKDGAVVRASEKVSFCLADWVDVVDDGLEHSAERTYLGCSQTRPQGISVGWGDIYGWYLPDQWVDVTGLPNGVYTLRSTVDPAGRIREVDESNNAASVTFRLRGTVVSILGP